MKEHRHLDVPGDIPPERLGPAALDDLLERGDLDDWAPLARALAADPHGSLAERVLRLCRAHPMYGTSALWEAYVQTLRAASHEAADLSTLRERRGLTQVDMAARLGLGQPRVSRIERARNPRVDTLRRCVAAVGGRLHFVVHFPDAGSPVTLSLPPERP